MVYILLFFLIILAPSLTWCPFDSSLLDPVHAAVTQRSSSSFMPQCAGLTLIGCTALYSWYTCNEKAIKLTTLCGALASSYILYKYVNGQEEIKELVTEATNHIIKTSIVSETRISNNLQKVSDHTEQQISSVHQSLQSDFAAFQQEIQQKMNDSLIEMRTGFLNIEKKGETNYIELEHTIQASSAHLEHTTAQRYLELSNMLDQKKEEYDRSLQESTNYTITQMQHMFQEFARAQSVTLSMQKHTFTPQKFTHFTPLPQVVRRSVSQPEISCDQILPTFTMRQQDINQEFEQTQQALKQKYAQKQTAVTERYALQQTVLEQTSPEKYKATYQHGVLTKPEAVASITLDTPEIVPFTQTPLIAGAGKSGLLGWVNIFALFNIFAR